MKGNDSGGPIYRLHFRAVPLPCYDLEVVQGEKRNTAYGQGRSTMRTL